MTEFISKLTSLAPLGYALGFLVFIIYGIFQNRTKTSVQIEAQKLTELRIANEVAASYKLKIEQLESAIKESAAESRREITKLTEKVGNLSGMLAAKEIQLAEYKAMVENRDPKLISVLDRLVGFMEKAEESNREILKLAKEAADRNAKIDGGHILAAKTT